MEAKYIDAKAFLEYEIHQSGFQPDMQDRHGNYRLLKNELEQFPAADVVPVTRCKDCARALTEDCRFFAKTESCVVGPDGDFFCADGQRRE